MQQQSENDTKMSDITHSETKNDIIIGFLNHYDLQNDTNKKILRDAFLDETGLSMNTFYYKLRKKNYKKKEVEVLAKITHKFRNDDSKVL